ncbi:hypothetical protein F7725_023362 [Dissostichus mawsoni]|uniref:Fanconi anemia core complex-associated protein 24 pseudonuclease domain-containing protein n=1 Tax=Dissostichus mawsoni TaxID=36200 RepID=A0A7J5Z3D3_DISMA|nr:hypothetical protein F7725_023362 [Dissostichus mawsoni]
MMFWRQQNRHVGQLTRLHGYSFNTLSLYILYCINSCDLMETKAPSRLNAVPPYGHVITSEKWRNSSLIQSLKDFHLPNKSCILYVSECDIIAGNSYKRKLVRYRNTSSSFQELVLVEKTPQSTGRVERTLQEEEFLSAAGPKGPGSGAESPRGRRVKALALLQEFSSVHQLCNAAPTSWSPSWTLITDLNEHTSETLGFNTRKALLPYLRSIDHGDLQYDTESSNRVLHQIGHVDEDVVICRHEEACPRAVVVDPVELHDQFGCEVVEGIQKVLLDQVSQCSLHPGSPLCVHTEGEHHPHGGSQFGPNKALVPPRVPDVLAPLKVRVGHQHVSRTILSLTVGGDVEVRVEEVVAVDQVAVRVGSHVADHMVVQLLPADHHHTQHHACGQQLQALALTSSSFQELVLVEKTRLSEHSLLRRAEVHGEGRENPFRRRSSSRLQDPKVLVLRVPGVGGVKALALLQEFSRWELVVLMMSCQCALMHLSKTDI